jgi:hypothetical protein
MFLSINGGPEVKFRSINILMVYMIFAGLISLLIFGCTELVTTVDPIEITSAIFTVQAGEDRVIVWPENSANLKGELVGDDMPDISSLTIAWFTISAPEGATVRFARGTTLNGIAVFSQLGIYTLRLTVSDGENAVTDDITVEVRAADSDDSDSDDTDEEDLAPVANASSTVTSYQTGVVFTLSGSDSDNTTAVLTYIVTASPLHGTLVDPVTGTTLSTFPYTLKSEQVRYIPEAEFHGTDSLRFKVFDSELYSEDAIHTFTVASPAVDTELVLYRISDTTGVQNTDNPGTAKTEFVPGESVRITLKSVQTGDSVPAICSLKVARRNCCYEVLYNSHDPAKTPTGCVEDVADCLVSGSSCYYSFDLVLPEDNVGSFDLAGTLVDVDFAATYDTTASGPATREAGWQTGFSVTNPNGSWAKIFTDEFPFVGSFQSIVYTSDGGFILVGYERIVRLDALGEVLWQRKCSDVYINAVREIDGGGFILGGYVALDNTERIWAAKISSAGEFLWQYTYLNSDYNYCTCVQPLSDGSIILAGYCKSYSKTLVLKLDSTGGLLWGKAFFYDYSNAKIYSVCLSADGNILLAGEANHKGIMFEITPDGQVVSAHYYAGTGYAVLYSVRKTADGGFILSGSHYQTITASDPDEESILVVRVDRSGNILWQKEFDSSLNDEARDICETPSGEFCLIGYSYEMSVSCEPQILKFDSAGTLLWQRVFTLFFTTVYSMDVIGQNGFVFAGSAFPYSYCGIAVRVDADGKMGDCSYMVDGQLTETSPGLSVSACNKTQATATLTRTEVALNSETAMSEHLFYGDIDENQKPQVADQILSISGEVTQTITLTADDSKSGPEDLSYILTALPSHGSLTDTVSGLPIDSVPYTMAHNTVQYTPTAQYKGEDNFRYKVCDSTAYSCEATVTLDVGAVPEGVTLTLYRISDTSGTKNTREPGRVVHASTPGQTIRLTFQAVNTRELLSAKCVLKVASQQDHTAIIYDSHDSSKTSSGAVEDIAIDLQSNRAQYLSFDLVLPANLVGPYDLCAALYQRDSEALVETTASGADTASFTNAWVKGPWITNWLPSAVAWGASKKDYPRNMEKTSDCGFVLLAKTYSYDNINKILVVRFDKQGNIQWQKAFGDDKIDDGICIRQTADNGFVFVGSVTDSGVNDSEDILIVRLDQNGNILWQKTYNGQKDDSAWDIRQTSDNGFIVLGNSSSSTSSIDGNLLLKLDSNGAILWQKTIHGSRNNIDFTADGNMLITGRLNSATNSSFLIAKTDASGNALWQKKFSNPAVSEFRKGLLLSDGGLMQCGLINDLYYNGSLFFMKMDSEGNLLWTRTLKIDGNYEMCLPYRLTLSFTSETTDGGYLVSGSVSFFNDLTFRPYTLRLDSSGRPLWLKYFYMNGHSYTSLQTEDLGFVQVNMVSDVGAGSYDIMLLRFDPDGYIADCPYLRDETVSEVASENCTSSTETFTSGTPHLTASDSNLTVIETDLTRTQISPTTD